jgi:hypothetical protein
MAISFTDDSASISTSEYSLPADTTSGVPTAQTDDCILQVWLGLSNMVAGDQYELKIYEKVLSTQRLCHYQVFTGAQSPVGVILPTIIVGTGWDVTMKRLAGSDRTIEWSLRKIT